MNDSEELLHQILHGNVTKGVPEPPSRTVKIFISSTKGDFQHERRQIHEKVFPELQKYCSSLGLDLQVMDPHWKHQSTENNGGFNPNNSGSISTRLTASQSYTSDFIDPFQFALQLQEIEDSHRTSMSTFFICLIGHKYRPSTLPTTIDSDNFREIYSYASEAGLGDASILHQWYQEDSNTGTKPQHTLVKRLNFFSSKDNRSQASCDGIQEMEQVIKIVDYGTKVSMRESNAGVEPFLSAVHQQVKKAMSLSKSEEDRILCFVRRFEGTNFSNPLVGNYFDLTPATSPTSFSTDISPDSSFALRQLIEELICGVQRKNLHFLSIPWNNMNEPKLDTCSLTPAVNIFPPPLPSEYLHKFGDILQQSLKGSIEKTLSRHSSYFDYWPEVICESHSHLSNCRKLMTCFGVSQSLETDCAPLLQVQKLMVQTLGDKSSGKHAPIVVIGEEGVGKSTLLSQVFTHCSEWIPEEQDIVRIVRHVGQSPASSYTSELLRNLCLHISLVYGFEIRTDIAYELSSLSIWFQELLKMVETTATDTSLVIVLDDLHNLKSPQTSTLLGWLPWNLASNIHLICSVSESEESILKLLKSRISLDNFIRLHPISTSSSIFSMLQSKLRDKQRTLTPAQWSVVKEKLDSHNYEEKRLSPVYAHLLTACVLSRWRSFFKCDTDSIPDTIEDIITEQLNEIEKRHGHQVISKIGLYISQIRYGLRETEIQELIMSEENLSDSWTNVWLDIKDKLLPFFKQYYLLGRPYFQWAHTCIANCVQGRYSKGSRSLHEAHKELASAFHLGFTETWQALQEQSPSDTLRRKDSFDILREIDELWYHLMMSGDVNKLKSMGILNIDFLMASVKEASVSYLRSILELVRGQILDFEIELLYNVTKHAVQSVSRDPHQLANEILVWLRPFTKATSGNVVSISSEPGLKSGSLSEELSPLNVLITETYSWCNNASIPLLVPTNSWLHLPLSPQVSVITTPWQSIVGAVIGPDGQNLIATHGNSLYFFHLASKRLIKTVEAHRQSVTCLCLSDSGQYLVTGCEDTSVHLWNIQADSEAICCLEHRLSHHVAGVLCVAITHSEKIILSGSEIGAICVTTLASGSLLTRLEHHRGMVTCIQINCGDDIFASGSTDSSVIIWSLEDFMVLNQIFLSNPIMHMDISSDSTFMILSCEDNSVHIRAVTTGSHVHNLTDHPRNAVVTYTKFAEDGCRVVLGSGDGKLYVYDVHSARLVKTLTGHQDMISSILTQPQDKFLITCGGNKIVIWNFYARKSLDVCNSLPDTSSNSIEQNSQQSTQSSQYSRPPSKRMKKVENHREPITCLDVSRDGNFAVTGSRDANVKVWNLKTGETHTTLQGHRDQITCVAFAPNGVFCVSGSEDQTLRVWGLTLGLIVSTFTEHKSRITTATVTRDSRRILSVDGHGIHKLWQADSGSVLISVQKPGKNIKMFGNMVFAIGGKSDNSVRFWSVYDPESEKSVSHTEPINCYTVTYDSSTIITGSQDMSLKVWEVPTGKITQVLVGHEESVSCVATAPLRPSMVISGSQDCNLIVWDMTTGSETFTLSGHLANVTDVKLTLDGTIAISASEDNTMMIWEVAHTGSRLTMLDVHHSILLISASLNMNQVAVQLTNNHLFPILKFHKNPAKDVALELPPDTPVQGDDLAKSSAGWRGIRPNFGNFPRRVIGRGHLKREQSFDSFYWDHLNRGVSIDDFRKVSGLSSPMGSKEHLPTTGIIWDGSSERDRLANLSRPSRLVSKLIANPKQKMLKKQQSMFAFFPEHGVTPTGGFRSQSPLISPVVSGEAFGKSTGKTPTLGRQLLGKSEAPSRSQSLDEPDPPSAQENSNSASANNGKSAPSVMDSAICLLM